MEGRNREGELASNGFYLFIFSRLFWSQTLGREKLSWLRCFPVTYNNFLLVFCDKRAFASLIARAPFPFPPKQSTEAQRDVHKKETSERTRGPQRCVIERNKAMRKGRTTGKEGAGKNARKRKRTRRS